MLNPKKQQAKIKSEADYQTLLLTNPVLPYYRQSTPEQFGNQSTFIQIVDSREYLKRLGWRDDLILAPIDDDKGYSGSLGPDNRPGLARLISIITTTSYPISIFVSNSNRLFRDETQILFNQFIQVCLANKTRIITQNMQYHFAHPQFGEMHIDMFRMEMVDAARFLKVYIRENLFAARERLVKQGLWVGQPIPTGYMVDNREKINGVINPEYRQFKLFEYFATVMREYFLLYKQFNRNLERAYLHIEEAGPYFPEDYQLHIPADHVVTFTIRTRSRITGGLMPSYNTFRQMFKNPIYDGHYVYGGCIVKMNNHPPLVNNALFRFAFERLSPYELDGSPNTNRSPHQKMPSCERNIQPPIYGSFLYSDDILDYGIKKVTSAWRITRQSYSYQLKDATEFNPIWTVKADFVDNCIDKLVEKHLGEIIINETIWNETLREYQKEKTPKSTIVKRDIQSKQLAYENLRRSLAYLSDPSIAAEVERDLQNLKYEISRLENLLPQIVESENKIVSLPSARVVLTAIVERWADIAPTDKIFLLQQLIEKIIIKHEASSDKSFTIYWKDGASSQGLVMYRNRPGIVWDQATTNRIKELFDSHVDQVDILKEFPKSTWSSLKRAYGFYFNNGQYPLHYRGHAPYRSSTRWTDTEEFKKTQKFCSDNDSVISQEIITHIVLAHERDVLTHIQNNLPPVSN